MQSHSVTRRSVTAVALAATALALALPAGAQETIQACYHRRNGKLRYLVPGKKCRKAERPVAWSQLSGAAAGGDLEGTYPAPRIAPGAVDATKLAAGAVTPDHVGPIPAVRAFRSTTFSVPHDTFVAVPLDGESFDTADLHDPDTAPGRFTVPRTGLYALTAHVNWFVNTTGSRVAQIWKNGERILVSHSIDGDTNADQILATLARLEAGDYVELMVKQTSGGSLLVATGTASGVAAESTPIFTMHWVGPDS